MYRKDFRPCSALVISSMRKHSYHAHVKHHTALSIAQHWRFQACANKVTTVPCRCQAPHSNEQCSEERQLYFTDLTDIPEVIGIRLLDRSWDHRVGCILALGW